MKELRRQLKELLQQAGADAEVLEAFSQENAVFPFSAESRILMYLMNAQAITYEQYQEIYESYMKRNQYLYLFEMAPRTFGETWGEQHILKLFPAFVKATKENMVSVYPDFDGEFDLWIPEIRVEVKACRANDTKAGVRADCNIRTDKWDVAMKAMNRVNEYKLSEYLKDGSTEAPTQKDGGESTTTEPNPARDN